MEGRKKKNMNSFLCLAFVSFLFKKKMCLMTQPLLFWASSPSCSPFWALPLCRPPSSSSTSLTSERHAKVSTLISSPSLPPPGPLSPLPQSLSFSLSCEWRVNDREWDSAAALQNTAALLIHSAALLSSVPVCVHAQYTDTYSEWIDS